MKYLGLGQRRIQYRVGAKVDRVQASFDLSHKGEKGQHHHPFSQFSCSVVSNSLRPLGLQHTRFPCPSLSLLEIAQTHIYWVRDAIQPSHPLSSPSPPAFNLSQHQGIFLASESVRCVRLVFRWPNYWSFSFSISPSNEYSGLISLRIDWLNLLAVQGTLKSLLQHHSSKASTLWRSAFFTYELSHPHMTTGKP